MNADVVVVGGGAVGLCCAYELARAGAAVTVLERAPTLTTGCSSGNAGLVCPSHAAPLASGASLRLGLHALRSREGPLAIAPRASLLPWLSRFAAAARPERERAATAVMRSLAAVSHELHARYATELGTGLTPRGTLDVYETGAALARAPHDPDSQLLSPVEAVELEPALSPGIAGAIFHPGELSGDPAAFVTAVAAAAVAAGVDLHSGNEVTSVRALRGRTVVLAAGAWTRGLARDAGLRVPVEAGKGYHVDYEALAGDPHIPVFVHESRIAVTRLADRLRVTGVLALHGLDLSVDRRRVAAIERTAAARIAGLQGRRPLELWAGLRPCSPDGLPIIGRSAAREDVIVATGHGMLGFALAPVTGRLVRQLVTGEQPVVELGQLRPDRFRPLMGRRAPSATRSPARA